MGGLIQIIKFLKTKRVICPLCCFQAAKIKVKYYT